MTDPSAEHTPKRYWGLYRGVVTEVSDPHKLGRVKIRVPEVLGQGITTDWAAPTAIAYGGMADVGDFVVPEIGAAVFVQFESGDVNRPLYSGTWWGHPEGKSPETPKLAQEDQWSSDPSTQSPKGDDSFQTGACGTEKQPGSFLAAAGGPKYPFNRVIKTKNNGMEIEIDDTPGKGRIHFWHGPSKSWFEMSSAGELSIRVADKSYVLVEADDRRHVKGKQAIGVEGDASLRTGGKYDIKTGGQLQLNIGGKMMTWVLGQRVDVVMGNYELYVMGKCDMNILGPFTRAAAGLITDLAAGILHSGGGPTGSAPPPPC